MFAVLLLFRQTINRFLIKWWTWEWNTSSGVVIKEISTSRGAKVSRMGWTWHGVPYFLFVFFLLTLTLRTNNWRVCSAGNIAKENAAILVYTPYIFYQKNVKNIFFPELLSGLGRLSINAFQIHITYVLTTSTKKLLLKHISTWFCINLMQKN